MMTRFPQVQYVTQSMYGCSSHSTPIIDPRAVLAFQKSLLDKDPTLFTHSLGASENRPEAPT